MSTTPSDNGAGFLPCRPFWRDGHLPLSSTARRAGSTEIGGISRPGWHSPDGCRRGESPRCDVVVVSCWRPALALSSWRRSLRGGEQAGNRAGVPGGRTTLYFATQFMTHAVTQAPMGPTEDPAGGKPLARETQEVPKAATHTPPSCPIGGATHRLPMCDVQCRVCVDPGRSRCTARYTTHPPDRAWRERVHRGFHVVMPRICFRRVARSWSSAILESLVLANA